MTTENMESTDTSTEVKETQVSTPSEDEQESSSETTESENETEETSEPKKTEETEEESFVDKVDRMAQSKADKSLVPLQQRNDKLTTENESLTLQLNEKTWDRNLGDLFDEESESKDEGVAAKRRTDREKVKTQVLEFQKNQAEVTKLKPLLEKRESSLNIVERTQGVREKLWPLFFPDEKKNLNAYKEALKKFEKTNDWDEVEIILEGIRGGLKGKTKKYVPDSAQQGGGGSVSDKQIMENYQNNPKNPEFATAYSELRQKKGFAS